MNNERAKEYLIHSQVSDWRHLYETHSKEFLENILIPIMASTTTTEIPSDFRSADLIDCPVNGTDTEDPNNVYTCKTGEECCTLDLLPACCGTKPMSEAM